MKPIVRYRTQLLYRRSYRPPRVLRVRPGVMRLSYRPRAGPCQPRLNRELTFLVSF